MTHLHIRLVLRLSCAVIAASVVVSSPARAQDPAPASGARTYQLVDRVEVNYGGTWYKGSILQVGDGRYKVMRDDYTSDDRWVTSADLRPLARPVRTLPTPPRPLPRQIPTGTYDCTTIMSGFSNGNSMRTTIGTLHVVGAGVYTGLTKAGTGPRSTFGYDAPTGRVDLEGGSLKGFFGKVVESRFGTESDGTPYLNVVYRVREGGNLFDLSCRRSGA